jgi:chromosome segregation ATPase
MEAMVIDAQANKEEIKNLNGNIEDKNDAMERLNLEVTVVVTERITLKKELDRMDHLYHQLQKDFKE